MEFVPIRSFDSYVSANIWRARFEDAGIYCYLKDEYTVTIDPILSNAIGGIKLCVNVEQLRESRELVERITAETQQLQRCPACASANVQFVSQPFNLLNWLTALFSWSLTSYALPGKQLYHCFDCGAEFDETQNEKLDTLAIKEAWKQ